MNAVKELENEIKQARLINHEFIVRNKHLTEENERLKATLAFYADRKNYDLQNYDTFSTIELDRGERARRELGK